MQMLLLMMLLSGAVVTGHAEGIVMTGVLQEATCVAKGTPYQVRLAKRFMRDTSPADVRAEGHDPRDEVILTSVAKTGPSIKYGYPCGKYAIVVTSDVKGEKRKLLGIHYYKWYGMLTATGPRVPYTSVFWNQRDKALYWEEH